MGQLSELAQLSLSNNWIKVVPEEISLLSKLQILSLGSNFISTLPRSITKLKGLISLVVDNNELTSLPEDIDELTSLQHLLVKGNKIHSLPPSVSKMTSLIDLEVSNNPISTLPSLSALTKLMYLFIGGMQLSKLPELPPNLKRLDINSNRLTGTISLCSPAIRELNINQNPGLTGIGPTPSDGSPCLPALVDLDAGGCSLESVAFLNGSLFLSDLELSDNRMLGNGPIDLAKAGAWPYLTSLRVQAIGVNMSIAAVLASVGRPRLLSLDVSRNPLIGGKMAPAIFDQNHVPFPIPLLFLKLDNTGISYMRSSIELRFPNLRTLSLRNTPIAVEVPWDQQYWRSLEALDVRGSNNRESNIGKPKFFDRNSTSVDIKTFSTCPSTLQGGSSSTYTIQADPVVYNYNGCVCLDSHFGEPSRGCQLCPASLPNVEVHCVGTGNLMTVTAGWIFYDVVNKTTGEGKITVKSCPSDSISSPCLISSFSLSIQNATDWRRRVSQANPRLNITTCAPGYEGRLCSRCSSGYFRSGRSCHRCGGRGLSWLNPLVSLFLLTALGIRSVAGGFKSRSGLIRTLTMHAQLLALLPDMSLQLSDWGGFLFKTTGGGAGGLRLNGLECEDRLGWDGFYGPFLQSALLPVAVLVGGLWIGLLSRFVAGTARSMPFRARYKLAVFYLWQVLLFGSIQRLLSALNCTRYGSSSGKRFLTSALWIACSGSQYRIVQAVGTVLGVGYILGTVVIVVYRLRPSSLGRSSISAFLRSPYTPESYYWEAVLLARRVALAVASSQSGISSSLLSVSFVTVLILSLSAQVLRKPYARPIDNRVETISLILLLTSYVVGIIYNLAEQKKALINSIGKFLFFSANLIFLIVLAVMILSRKVKRGVEKYKEMKESRDGFRGSRDDAGDIEIAESREVPLLIDEK